MSNNINSRENFRNYSFYNSYIGMIEFTIYSKVMYHHPQILTTFSILALQNDVGKCGQHLALGFLFYVGQGKQ